MNENYLVVVVAAVVVLEIIPVVVVAAAINPEPVLSLLSFSLVFALRAYSQAIHYLSYFLPSAVF